MKKKVNLPKDLRPSPPPDEIRYNPIYCEMQRLRHNMIFHSLAYYEYGFAFIDDHLFDKWAKRLVEMQAQYPDWVNIVPYADQFEDWDGSTGYHLVDVGNKFLSKIYHHINYMIETEPEAVTPEMQEFVDNIKRGIK